jgi:replicative superfamily II helicase
VSEGKQVIVFREVRGEARGCAAYLARELGLPRAQEVIGDLPTGDPSGASAALRQALAGGVAFHISDLDRTERLVIEDHFRHPGTKLRVIAATTTLAMGVNTPAEAVVIVGLTHPPDTPYSVAEYKNMVGRAGRLGFADRGTSFLLAVTPRDEHLLWDRYVRGVPENIESRFLARETDLRSLVIRVIVAAQRTAAHALTPAEVIEFLDSSFGAFQQRLGADHWSWDRQRIEGALTDLESHELIERDHAGGYRITRLGHVAGAGIEVESVVRLVDALRSAMPESINEPTLIAATQITVELDGVLFPINRKSTKKEPATWMSELQRQDVAPSVLRSLHRNVENDVEATLRAKKAAACLLWITEWPMARIEDTMTQFGGKFDGAAGPIRSVAARTCDLLPTVIQVAELLHPGLDLGERGARLLARVTVGVPGEIVELAAEIGNGFDRSDYQALMRAGISSVQAVELASDEALRECLRNVTKVQVARQAVADYRGRECRGDPLLPPILPMFER